MTLYAFQLRLADIALDMMERAVAIDRNVLKALAAEVEAAMTARRERVEAILGAKLDRLNKEGEPTFFRSGPQIKALMERLGQRPGTNRKTGRDAFDDETLFRIGKRTPGLAPLCHAIMEYRTLGNMRANFIRARLEPSGRMRTSWNTAGPETFRWSSSTNAFWRGANLENIAKPFHSMTGAELPNLRAAIVPDPGKLLWEPDLAGADAQVVARDSGDVVLQQMFREKVKIHAERAKFIYGASAGADGRKEPYYTLAKKGGHLWTYCGKSRTMATSLGITVSEADRIVARLAGVHPGIPAWWKRLDTQIKANRTITNAFGYRFVWFGRVEDALPKATAWIGQGTVACVINRACVALADGVPAAELLMNQHDSLVGQTDLDRWDETRPLLKAAYDGVVIPYPEPLVIPPELKTSPRSWGHMEKCEW